MPASPRRSWLLTPLSHPDKLDLAITSAADVILLDLAELVAEHAKPKARQRARPAIQAAVAANRETFVQVDVRHLDDDLRACVWPGLSGIVISRGETVAQIKQADSLLTRLESERGMPAGTVRTVVACETAQANHAAFDLASASLRIWGLTLGRADLIMDLRPEPSGEIHMMLYLMQRLITIASATSVVPLGAWWRAPDRGLLATAENTRQAALRGRAIGFRGALCINADQVEPLNQGYTPGVDEQRAARELISTYDAALANGRTLLQQGNRLIDCGAARRARNLIDLAAGLKDFTSSATP